MESGPPEGIDWKSYPILAVDDEQDNLDILRFNFRRELTILPATSGQQALEILAEHDIAVVLTDQRMPGMSGLELLGAAAELRPEAVGLIVTAYTELEILVDAINSGHVYRYIAKPWKATELRILLHQAIETFHLRRTNRLLLDRLQGLSRYLDGEVRRAGGGDELVGHTDSFEEMMESVRGVAPTSSTVLLRGESGTGKELVARAIHDLSPRASGPFVRVACGALSPGVLESELFGHERGAFTGAFQRKLGRFELAHGGTIFLDEIGDLPPATQVKLLRVLQERELERVGGTKTVAIDVRVVSATHQDLEGLIARGMFREDLYYRLNVFPIVLAPLRERRDDIPLLAEHLLAQIGRNLGKAVQTFSPAALRRLQTHRWPGNVRELQNVVERAVIRSEAQEIGEESIDVLPAGGGAPAQPVTPQDPGSLADVLEGIERHELQRALAEAGGQKAEAARSLGINRSTLYYRLRKHGLD